MGKIRLGAYVWPGLTYDGGHKTERLFREFPGREPEWGWTVNSVENMEYQIDLAADHGLSFFCFDWYYLHGRDNLSNSIRNFVRAKNRGRLEFCLNICNHTKTYREEWQNVLEVVGFYTSQPNYLRIDGKAVVMIYDIPNLIDDFGGIGKAKAALDEMRLITNGAYLLACECPYGTPETGAIDFNYEAFSPEMLKKRYEKEVLLGFDGVTSYNSRRYSPMNGSYETTYDVLVSQHEKSWEAVSEYCPLPYAPNILAGWDCRPWETGWFGNTTGYRSCYGLNRSGESFRKHIINAEKWIENNNSVSDLAFIYAWDELCEGGYMIPTKGEGYEMLDGMKNAVAYIGTDKM